MKNITKVLRQSAGESHGVTLIELLISLFILGLVSAGLYSMMIQAMHVREKSINRDEVQQNARKAVDQMTREIRGAIENSKAPAIITNSPRAIRFFSRANSTNSYVQFRFDSGAKTIYRDVLNKPVDLAEWVAGSMGTAGTNIVEENIADLIFVPATYNFAPTTGAQRSFRLEVHTSKYSPYLSAAKLETSKATTVVNLRNY